MTDTPSPEMTANLSVRLSANDAARIDCQGCELPAAMVVAGALVIKSRHHGKSHVTIVSLEKVRQLLETRGP